MKLSRAERRALSGESRDAQLFYVFLRERRQSDGSVSFASDQQMADAFGDWLASPANVAAAELLLKGVGRGLA